MNAENIIKSASIIHRKYRNPKDSVSGHTKTAIQITKAWQNEVCIGQIEKEVSVSKNTNEKIDIVDFTTGTAYELKVSGKNPHHEFYKDVFKVLTHNLNFSKKKIKKLVFITEEYGIIVLAKRIDKKMLEMLKTKHELSVDLAIIETGELYAGEYGE